METDPEPADESTRGHKRTASEADLAPYAPRRIKPLAQDVVNKIAAGEIIVAPVNALKEMMENSIDAGSTSIEIQVKDGGLKLLQISDNGHGIEKDDLAILCERFTTSKLKDFDDLLSIGTYGFRGEALASISHIAHLRVTTKTAGSSCAWQAHYQDGKLIPAKPGQSPDPKPSPGRPGTQITVEDLFYNIPNRRRAFRSPGDEYTKILDVITRYAVHCEDIAFSLKKQGEAGAGLSVAAATSKIDRIKQAYGAQLVRELVEFDTQDEKWGFKASGYCSSANWVSKRTTVVLFINHRSVESSAVKKALEQAYQIFLPKGAHPFVYLSLEIDPARVDVNVHPTKREVHFLSEDEIIDLVCVEIKERLAKVDTSRTFKTQTLIPTIDVCTQNPSMSNQDRASIASPQSQTPATKRPYENSLVRTDSKMRKITSMLPPALSSRQSVDKSDDNNNVSPMISSPAGVTYRIDETREHVPFRLTSLKTLRARVRDAVHSNLTEVFANLTYVGLTDPTRRLSAMQSGVNLYLVDYGMISNELFYQIGITDFGNFGKILLRPPDSAQLPLRSLLKIAADLEIELDESMADLDADTMVDRVYDQLLSRRDMLREYFSLEIDDQGHLICIPMLLKGYIPCLAKLPTFLLRLGPYVDWTDELECFRTLLTELSTFYVPEVLPQSVMNTDRDAKQKDAHNNSNSSKFDRAESVIIEESDVDMQDGAHDDDENVLQNRSANSKGIDHVHEYHMTRRREIEHALEHIIFPAFRARLLATKGMLQGIVEVANLKGLYKVFERC